MQANSSWRNHYTARLLILSLEAEHGVDFCVPILRDLLSDTLVEGTEKAVATQSAEEVLEKDENTRRRMAIDPNDFVTFQRFSSYIICTCNDTMLSMTSMIDDDCAPLVFNSCY